MFLFEVFFNKIGFRGINCQIFLENNINDFLILLKKIQIFKSVF